MGSTDAFMIVHLGCSNHFNRSASGSLLTALGDSVFVVFGACVSSLVALDVEADFLLTVSV